MERVVWLGLFAQLSCYVPSFDACAVRCGDVTACPSGMSCLGDGFCHDDRAAELCPDRADAAAGAPDAAVGRPDASPPADVDAAAADGPPPGGPLHVQLVWDTPHGDVGIHVRRPDASQGWFSGDDCFYANNSPDWPPLGPEGNPGLDFDDQNGFGPENINFAQGQASGTYAIGLEYYCSDTAGGDGPTRATVSIWCGAAPIGNIVVDLDRTGRFVEVASLTWPDCHLQLIENATWITLVEPASAQAPFHCTINCISDDECTPGERCDGVGGVCVLQ